MVAEDIGAERRARLAAARLYLVCPEGPARASETERELPELVRAAVAGGVDIVQLREKHLPDDQLVAVAKAMRALCERVGALLIVNDRPLVARQAGADGVHVGQEDMPVAEARALVGPDVLIGLSTHAREEIDRADAACADYIAVDEMPGLQLKGKSAETFRILRVTAIREGRSSPWVPIPTEAATAAYAAKRKLFATQEVFA